MYIITATINNHNSISFSQINRGSGNWKYKPQLIKTLLFCDLCKYQTMKKTNLHRHMRSAHVIQISKCKICSRAFETEIRLKAHMVQVHIGHKFKCLICNMNFKRYQALSIHVEKQHSSERSKTTFACDLCGVDYYSKLNLDVHMKGSHRGPYKCFVITCKKGFAKSSGRKKHYTSCHIEKIKVKRR